MGSTCSFATSCKLLIPLFLKKNQHNVQEKEIHISPNNKDFFLFKQCVEQSDNATPCTASAWKKRTLVVMARTQRTGGEGWKKSYSKI